MRRLLALVAVTVAAALAVVGAGCGGASDSTGGAEDGVPRLGGTLRVAQLSDVITLNPWEALDGPSIVAASQITEPLFHATQDGIEPALVREFSVSPSGTKWTFVIRPGVRFSDGTPLTAEDVVFSLGLARKSPNYQGPFEQFSNVRASSQRTVVITTKQPVAAMESTLSLFSAAIVPKDFGGETEKQFFQHPVGTGPFKVASWKRGESLTLERNARYWRQGRPYLDELVLQAVAEDNSRVARLQGGDLDLIQTPPASQLAALEGDADIRVQRFAYGHGDFLLANVDSPAFGNRNLREAANVAVDRQGIIQAALGGNGRVGGAWLPPAVLYHDDAIKAPARSVSAAKEQVRKAEAAGAESEITLLLLAGDTYAANASQVIQQNLEEVGFDVELQPLDLSALIAKAEAGEFDLALLGVETSSRDPESLAQFYDDSNAIFTGANTVATSKLAEEGATELDKGRREEIYLQQQKIVAEEVNLISLDYQPYTWASQANVTGLEVEAAGIPWFANAGFAR